VDSMVDEERIVTLTGYLRVLITLEKSVQSTSLAFTRSAIEIKQNTVYFQIVNLAVGEERIVMLKEGLYTVRAHIGDLYSEWANTEIKNGTVTSRIFHFGSEPSK
jgi:hypothetical protein